MNLIHSYGSTFLVDDGIFPAHIVKIRSPKAPKRVNMTKVRAEIERRNERRLKLTLRGIA